MMVLEAVMSRDVASGADRHLDIGLQVVAGVEEANMHWSGKTKCWSEIL